MTARRLHFDDFDDLIAAWFPLTNALNSLNRSMGLMGLFLLPPPPAAPKERFVLPRHQRGGGRGETME